MGQELIPLILQLEAKQKGDRRRVGTWWSFLRSHGRLGDKKREVSVHERWGPADTPDFLLGPKTEKMEARKQP